MLHKESRNPKSVVLRLANGTRREIELAIRKLWSTAGTMHDACQLFWHAIARPPGLRDDLPAADVRMNAIGHPRGCSFIAGGFGWRAIGGRPGASTGRRPGSVRGLRPPTRPDHATVPMMNFRDKLTGPFGDARSARRWLDTLPGNDPVLVQREILAALEKLADRTARRTPSGLEAVFALDAYAEGLVRNLVAQYVEHANRSSKIESQLWQALFDLTKGFQACHAAFAREIKDNTRHKKWQLLLPELIARQIGHLGLDAKLRLFRYERWIPAKWAELHALFARAFSCQVERQPLLLDPKRGPTTIEHKYLVALMLQLADPGNLTPRQIEWVASQLDDWCRPLRFTVAPRSATTFFVDLAGSAGLRRRSLGPLEGRVLFVDTLPMHALLLENRAALEQGVRGDPLSRRTPQQREQLELFVKLASRIDPEIRPIARRGERVPASGAVDAVIGFDSISNFLRDEPAFSMSESDTGRSFASTMDLAVFGHARIEPDFRLEHPRRRLALFAAPGGPWEIKDISTSGFRLHAPMSVATEVKLSMLVAIDRCGQNAWVMGIVRRMRRLSTAYAEIGLQLIANSLVSAELVEQRKSRDADYTVDREPTTIGERRFRGLFLSYSRRPGEPAVQSLIVPHADYQPGKRYALHTPGSVRVIRYGRLLEQHTDWVWTVIEPLDPAAPASGAAAAP